jgi:hypothetical protein
MSSSGPRKVFLKAGEDVDARALADELTHALFAPEQSDQYWSPSPTCKVCGDPSTGQSTAFLCSRCKKVLGKNLTAEQKAARFKHMREQ